MRLALLGDHPDGRAFVRAALHSGRHELAVYCGNQPEWGKKIAPSFRVTKDLEDVLADPKVEACVVAVPIKDRLDVARRVLQSERHALVVHPVDLIPPGAYELDMLRGDTHQALLPLIVEHIGLDRKSQQPDPVSVVELTIEHPHVSLEHGERKQNPALPNWTLLRRHGGEIAEIQAFAEAEEIVDNKPLMINGRFEKGGLFQISFRPGEKNEVVDEHDDRWVTIVEEFEKEVEYVHQSNRAEPAAGGKDRPDSILVWRDEVRALELDDAVTRSLAKRRAQLMEYQDASEEVGFKGTMTLVGCALLWIAIILLVISAWAPWAGWLILPAIIVFLGLQTLRYVIPK